MLLHCNSPSENASDWVSARPFWLFRFENRVTLYVHPVGGLRWNMTAQAVFFVVRCHLLIGGVGFEECPSPSISPQRIAGIATLLVFDHDEPHFGLRSPMCVPGRQLRMVSCKDFFHQYSSVRELSILAVILSCARRRVRVVHLGVVVQIDRCINSKLLIEISEISRLADVPRLVDKIKAVGASHTLGTNRLLAC